MSAAKLYVTRRLDTPFQVVYRDPLRREKSGRAKRVTRWFADRKEAEAYQRALDRDLLVQGVAGVAFDANVRADAQGARQLLDAAGHPGVSLRWLAEQYAQRVTHQAAAHQPIGQAVAEFLEEKERAEGRTPLTVANLKVRIWKWINAQGIATVADVTRTNVEPLRTAAGLSAQTRRNDLNALSSFCSFLVDRRKIDVHPLKGLRRPVVPWKTPAIYTAAECLALLKAAAGLQYDECLGTVAVLLFTGARVSELEETRLFYGENPVARIEGGKLRGRANRIVTLIPAAVAWLKLAGEPKSVRPLNRGQRRRLCAAAELTWPVDVCRHTFISHRAALLNNDGQVAKEAGTSETMIFRHYRRLVEENEARAWAELRPDSDKS